MKNKKKLIKVPVRFEFAFEVIYKSALIIFFGLTYLFATNLLRINGYSVVFGLITLILIYLRRSSYLIIEDNQLELVYFKFFKEKEVEMEEINKCLFYENSPLVKLRIQEDSVIKIYLKEKNKEKLLDYLVTHYPEISSVYINHNEKNS